MDADTLPGFLQGVVPALLSGLVFALSLRIAADYNAIVLNAFHSERDIFKSQGVSLLISSVLNVLLTWQYGLYGTVVSVASGALIYLLATTMFARRRFAMQEAAL
jgi:O-antigen/teichoic acid export membrane protein